YSSLPAPSPDGDAWTTAQKQGGWWGATPGQVGQVGRIAQAGTTPRRFADPQFDGDAAGYPFHFLPFASQAFLDGSLAHLPWLQEMPDPMSTARWSSWVEINPRTAARLGIGDGGVVETGAGQGEVEAAPVRAHGA